MELMSTAVRRNSNQIQMFLKISTYFTKILNNWTVLTRKKNRRRKHVLLKNVEWFEAVIASLKPIVLKNMDSVANSLSFNRIRLWQRKLISIFLFITYLTGQHRPSLWHRSDGSHSDNFSVFGLTTSKLKKKRVIDHQ